MTLNASTQSLLAQLRAHLKTLYGKRLCQVMRFGSHARGDVRPHSDVDMTAIYAAAPLWVMLETENAAI